MKRALYWWCNHLGVVAGGICIGAGNVWLGVSLTVLAAYFIIENYGFVD